MDKKKKFFIGLGVLTVIYVVVMGLNFTHQGESDGSAGNKFSESKVSNMIKKWKNDPNRPKSLTSAMEAKSMFSFLLPRLDLFDNKTDTDYCNVVINKDESFILLNQKRQQCVLFINKSKDSARLASLHYESESKQTASRGFNVNKMNKTMVSNTITTHSLIKPHKVQPGKTGKQPPAQAVKMIFLKEIDQSYYNIENPDKKNFQLSNFTPRGKDKQATFDTIEKNEFELVVPEKGGVFVLKCTDADCNKNNIKIRQTN